MPLRAAEFAIVSSAIEAVFADADAAARELAHVPSPKSDEILADPDLLVTSDLVELILGQKASDVGAVDAAAYRLLGRCGGMPVPPVPGLRAAVLLAQASTHLWHGMHEDVGALLDEALAEAQRDGMPGIELEVLGMMAFFDSYWSRTNHADDAARRADALRKHNGLGLPPALELAATLRSLIAGEPDDWTRPLQADRAARCRRLRSRPRGGSRARPGQREARPGPGERGPDHAAAGRPSHPAAAGRPA